MYTILFNGSNVDNMISLSICVYIVKYTKLYNLYPLNDNISIILFLIVKITLYHLVVQYMELIGIYVNIISI